MLSKVFSAALLGLDAQIIEVETDVSYGLRHFEIVGLPDKAVEESKERVEQQLRAPVFNLLITNRKGFWYLWLRLI